MECPGVQQSGLPSTVFWARVPSPLPVAQAPSSFNDMFSGVRVVVMSAQQLLLLSLREFDQLILQQVEKTSGALLHFLGIA